MQARTKTEKEAQLLTHIDNFIGVINAAIDRAYTIPIYIYNKTHAIPEHLHPHIEAKFREAGWKVDKTSDRDGVYWRLS